MRVQGRGLPQAIPGSNWTYQLHGVGVRFDRGFGVGGIDFDFDVPTPSFFRFRDFAECQFNAGNLPAEWRDLIEDESRLERAFAAAIAETITPS